MQPHIFKQIIQDIGVTNPKTHSNPIPSSSSRMLYSHKDSEIFDNIFYYRSVTGKTNDLEESFRLDIVYISHQCEYLSSDTRTEHARAMMWLGRHLKRAIKKGAILKPRGYKGFHVYIDTYFIGNCNMDEVKEKDTVRLRNCVVIMYEGCPII